MILQQTAVMCQSKEQFSLFSVIVEWKSTAYIHDDWLPACTCWPRVCVSVCGWLGGWSRSWPACGEYLESFLHSRWLRSVAGSLGVEVSSPPEYCSVDSDTAIGIHPTSPPRIINLLPVPAPAVCMSVLFNDGKTTPLFPANYYQYVVKFAFSVRL